MNSLQPGILADVPAKARYQLFELAIDADIAALCELLCDEIDGDDIVLGLGQPFLDAAGSTIDGLICPPVFAGGGRAITALPAAVCLWFRGDDQGEIVRRALAMESLLAGHLNLLEQLDAFRFAEGRDLSGYVDGTENPTGDAALQTAAVGSGAIAGSSFLALQKWQHDLQRFAGFTQTEQDDLVGRRLADNEEFASAPPSAHVKRSAQESFTPEAFMLRRSMPYADYAGEGLVFTAFAGGFGPFTAIMNRMLGHEDGITDGLFEFSHCDFTSFFWCPAMNEGELLLPFAGG